MRANTMTITLEDDIELADTEDGNAELVALYFRSELKYVPELDHWFEWRDNRWMRGYQGNGLGAPMRRVAEMVREYRGRYARGGDEAGVKRAARFQSKRAITGVANLTSLRPSLTTNWERFETHRNVLVTPNAYISLMTGEPLTGDGDDLFAIDGKAPMGERAKRDLLMTRAVRPWWDPDATCETWERCLGEWFHDRVEADAFQRLVGYAFTGTVAERSLAICYGPTTTGKTTCLNALLHVAGDYGATFSVDNLLWVGNESARQADPEVAMLMGTRFVMTSEVNQGRRMNEAKVKKLASKGVIKARMLRENPIEFPVTHTTFMDTNEWPIIDDDPALFKRLIMPVFDRPVERADGKLDETLWGEAAGILNWVIQGAVDYHRGGIVVPERWADALEDYRRESTPLDRWHMEQVLPAEGGREAARDVLDDISEWWREAGLDERLLPNDRRVKSYLTGRGYEHKHTKRGSSYIGFLLTTERQERLAPPRGDGR